MSDELFAVLEYLVNHPQIPYKSIDQLFGNNAPLVLCLRDMDYVLIKQENPNLWYLLPEDQQQDYFVFLSSPGLEAYRLEKKIRDEQAAEKAEQKRKEEIEEERWRKEARRSWLQFFLNALFGLIGFAAGVWVEHYFAILEVVLAIL